MPISSGALEWPASFYRKPEEEERGSDAGSLTPVNSPRDYKWQPQLTNRENYETWRKEMDRKDPLRTRKRKKGNCCDCFGQSKVNVQKEDVVIDSNRENSWDVIKRRRRRRCCLLGFCLSLAFTVLVAIFVFAFLHFTGFKELPSLQCTGQWRKHFLANRTVHCNGTSTYSCCCLDNIKNSTVGNATCNKGPVWPDGFIITSPDYCSDLDDFDCEGRSQPTCDTCPSCRSCVEMVLVVCLVALMMIKV